MTPLDELTWIPIDEDPADKGGMERLTEIKENRSNRLKALGNAQVPACAVAAWDLLVPKK